MVYLNHLLQDQTTYELRFNPLTIYFKRAIPPNSEVVFSWDGVAFAAVDYRIIPTLACCEDNCCSNCPELT